MSPVSDALGRTTLFKVSEVNRDTAANGKGVSASPGAAGPSHAQERVFRDAHGSILADGDAVTVIKDLKIKGSSAVVKVGTKVRNIRLVDGDHDIEGHEDAVSWAGEGFDPEHFDLEQVNCAV